MIVTKCIVQLTTHQAVITVDDRACIHVFKSNSTTCDFDMFTHDQQDQASDYICASLPTVYYSVTFPGECS